MVVLDNGTTSNLYPWNSLSSVSKTICIWFQRLWELNVDPETKNIPLQNLWVELKAGGISALHEADARHTLRHLQHLDLFDFLTYIPLFIMIHQSVVENPLDDSRDK
jgi:hypothetical protein